MTPPRPYTTEAEYLAYDVANEGRHEYYGGEIVSVSGVSEAHVLVSVNLTILIGSRLRGTGCRAYNGDMRVRLGDTDAYAAARASTPRAARSHRGSSSGWKNAGYIASIA
ncbi:MAG: Uma2 family endonuclease [Myxococcota bacterium]